MRVMLRLLLISLLFWPTRPWARELVLLTTEYPPYSMQAQPGGGLFTELISEAMARKGWTLTIRTVPWARVPADIAAARADGALICWPEELKKFNLLASRPVFISELGFFVRKSDAQTINVALAGLAGQRVGAVRGYGYPPALAASGALIDYVQDDQTNLRKLLAGRIAYVALERMVGEYLLQTHKSAELRDQIVWKGPAFAKLPLYVGIAKHRPDSAQILADLNSGLASMEKDGRYLAMLRAYHVDARGLAQP